MESEMGNIFYIMGKSSSGKDTIFQELQNRAELGLRKIVLYTTRPKRSKETEGVEYHFVNEEVLEQLQKSGKVIELRAYNTVQGIWKYFTVDDENLDLDQFSYLAIGTLVSYEKMKNYFGDGKIVPIYIEVSDDIRLERALIRERKQSNPDYNELCRRFLADSEDFSEKKLEEAGIDRRFENNGDRSLCIAAVEEFIRENLG